MPLNQYLRDFSEPSRTQTYPPPLTTAPNAPPSTPRLPPPQLFRWEKDVNSNPPGVQWPLSVMSWDFWAGYVSGAAGIVVGSPLDLLKVQKQAGWKPAWKDLAIAHQSSLRRYASLTRGALAPILGYGGLNGLLFVTYNRTLLYLDPSITDVTRLSGVSDGKVWLAGAAGGLASWVISAPTELIKCRKQLGDPRGMVQHVRETYRNGGAVKLYRGGAVTSVRDAAGYGFYFWTYEKAKQVIGVDEHMPGSGARIMLCGGIAGVATWASIYPLDVIKTRVQGADLLRGANAHTAVSKVYTWRIIRCIYHEGGSRAFFQGLGACSIRAFIVNAVQWYIYEAIMRLRPATGITLDLAQD